MKRLPVYALLFITLITFVHRFLYPAWEDPDIDSVITWDIFGYYLYLPAIFIYDDLEELKFAEPLREKYSSSPGLYQVFYAENQKPVIMYSSGMAVVYSPFFFVAHTYAKHSAKYSADGLSTPYHFAIGVGTIFYFLIGFFFLYKVLLHYFDPVVTTVSLLAVFFGTNLFYYASIEAQTAHPVEFAIYAAVVWLCISWARDPKVYKWFITGLLMGLAVLVRPSHLIIVLVPVLFINESGNFLIKSWRLYLQHWLFLGLGCFIAGFPQLIYWKMQTGSWLYFSYTGEWLDFTQPHIYEGLFGYTTGWLLYAPVVVFALLGVGIMFYLKRPYRWFTGLVLFLHIYIVLSWSNWWYGGGFGHRAFVDAYPLVAFGLAEFVLWVKTRNSILLRIAMSFLIVFFTGIVLFQTWQFHRYLIGMNNISPEFYWDRFWAVSPEQADYSMLYPDVNFDDKGLEKISPKYNYDKSLVVEKIFGEENPLVVDSLNYFPVTLKMTPEELEATPGSYIQARASVKFHTLPTDSVLHVVFSFEDKDNQKNYKYYNVNVPLKAEEGYQTITADCFLVPFRFKNDDIKVYIYNSQGSNFLVRYLKIIKFDVQL